MNEVDKRHQDNAQSSPPLTGALRDAIPIEVLMQGKNEVFLSHNSEIYRLRSTRNGKLILTK